MHPLLRSPAIAAAILVSLGSSACRAGTETVPPDPIATSAAAAPVSAEPAAAPAEIAREAKPDAPDPAQLFAPGEEVAAKLAEAKEPAPTPVPIPTAAAAPVAAVPPAGAGTTKSAKNQPAPKPTVKLAPATVQFGAGSRSGGLKGLGFTYSGIGSGGGGVGVGVGRAAVVSFGSAGGSGGSMPIRIAKPTAYTGDTPPPEPEREEREQYGKIDDHAIKQVTEAPVSTFSIDVDTGAYANVRRQIREGRRPTPDAVRVEELINYFTYDYTMARRSGHPFAVSTEVAPCPWNPEHLLLRVGLRATDVDKAELPPANLVFLVDVSGSMQPEQRLPLLKKSLKLLVDQLRPQDKVALVTYAGATEVVLPSTSGADKATILAAIDRLSSGGGTAGEAGIQLAYQQAQAGFISGGINRILLGTDGDFNVGITSFDDLKQLAADKRKTGISLTTLGFGVGNYNDHLMEQLADAGDGAYAYIDTLNEGHKVLVEQMTQTLAVVAKDVKIQVEFNPAAVREYRQIGYENRKLKREDFANDKVDAGEVGAGTVVTALYELTPVGSPGAIEPLRYAQPTAEPAPTSTASRSELAFLRVRYKAPSGGASKLMEVPVAADAAKSAVGQASSDFRFAASVAAFGQLLRGGTHLGSFGWSDMLELARGNKGEDRFGYRAEFVQVAQLAKALKVGE